MSKIARITIPLDVPENEQRKNPILVTAERKQELMLEWTEGPLSEVGAPGPRLIKRTAPWGAEAALISISAPAPAAAIEPRHLRWAATIFDMMASINADLQEEETETLVSTEPSPLEFVPAWPYVVLSRALDITDGTDESPFALSLIGPVVRRSALGGLAFFREGIGRLKTEEVAIADAWLWRIGFAVTDLLGLAGELDTYRKIDVPPPDQDLRPAEYLLKAMLRRLRGEFAPTAPLPRHSKARHLPATAYRALELLRHFPDGGLIDAGFSYALSVEVESRAMEARLSREWSLSCPGQAAAFLERVSVAVITRLPAKWASALPHSTEVKGVIAGKRRTVAAWDKVSQLLEEMPSPALDDGNGAFAHRGWKALKAGVRLAALVAWLRALTFELEMASTFPLPITADIPADWVRTDASLLLDTSATNILQVYTDALHKKEGRMASLRDITPVGWLFLIVTRLRLYEDDGGKEYFDGEVQSRLRAEASAFSELLISSQSQETINQDEWPFEWVSATENAMLENGNYHHAISFLASIDRALGLEARTVYSNAWGIRAASPHFVDASGNAWKLTKWLVDQVPLDKRLEEKPLETPVTRVWSETRNGAGDLLGVAALGFNFANLVRLDTGDLHCAGQVTATYTPHVPEAASAHLPHSIPEPQAIRIDTASNEAGDDSSGSHENIGEQRPANQAPAGAQPDAYAESRKIKREWDRQQLQTWSRLRRVKARNHVRIALMQFRVDDSYVHPLLEVGLPTELEDWFDPIGSQTRKAQREETVAREGGGDEKHGAAPTPTTVSSSTEPTLPFDVARAAATARGAEDIWSISARLPSWAEHRRRKLLSQAVEACEAFGVEVLVLPEYSVRPDTIAWLKGHLERSGRKLSVMAGTYRLHGNRTDLHFAEQFSEIFGVSDRDVILSSTLEQPQEKAAFATLLHPIKLDDAGHVVSMFTRQKKYPSVAMSEIFNPAKDSWSPLLTIEKLSSYVREYLASKRLPELSADEMMRIARLFPAAERIAEVICSELFITTHPVNWGPVEDEFEKLRVRFGGLSGNSKEGLAEDLQIFAQYLGLVAPPLGKYQADRRTIIVVPAYTSRSADYWVYGQSALLAAGITTVFCAAVSKISKGGSCFIGKSSWANEKAHPGFIAPVTPYAGWSRGIYYCTPEDALGPKEQAIVIADIDPVYMNEGKPRPQSLPVPLQLVAHLPIVETLYPSSLSEDRVGIEISRTAPNGAHAGGRDYVLGSATEKKLHNVRHDVNGPQGLSISSFGEVESIVQRLTPHAFIPPSVLMNPRTRVGPSGETILNVARELERVFSDKTAFRERLNCWGKDWNELPSYGSPPALIDWLWVDLTQDERLPDILVPPWRRQEDPGITDK